MEEMNMLNSITKNKTKIWYMLCFVCLGIIDQRRGSAIGEIQMLFSNLTGIVIALLTVPSLKLRQFMGKKYLYWMPVCVLLTIAACAIGSQYWSYQGQWITAVLNVAVWSYLIIYIWDNRKTMGFSLKSCDLFHLCMLIMLLLMIVSVRGKILPLWYLVIFGGFYVIGIPSEKKSIFLDGMLNGIIVNFFVLQIIAFGFRPYDYIRYHGIYGGETQNGLFYMITFCAFLCKWKENKEKEKKILSAFFFFMAAGFVSFILFTGSRAALLGVIMATVVIITYRDILIARKFNQWILHGLALVMCIVITFPAVYGCIRYLPTILHHPIWFQGEYESGRSVCSFDPWNSSKYVTLDEAMEKNIGRVLKAMGIDYDVIIQRLKEVIDVRKVSAAELTNMENIDAADVNKEIGSSPDNPYRVEGMDISDGVMGARIVIYVYYLQHLNFVGHTSSEGVFYLEDGTEIGHAHNMFLQMAYDYGIIVGIIFLSIYIYGIICALRHMGGEQFVSGVFLLAILCFGLLEMVIIPGQITVSLIGILLYFVKESRERNCHAV